MGIALPILRRRAAGGGGIPANALRDRAGDPILDRAGNYILVRDV
jgi:hypothetical protein